MKFKFLFFGVVAFSLFWLFSCKKDNPAQSEGSIVEGRVFDILSNQPIAGAHVELWEDDQGGDTRLSAWDR